MKRFFLTAQQQLKLLKLCCTGIDFNEYILFDELNHVGEKRKLHFSLFCKKRQERKGSEEEENLRKKLLFFQESEYRGTDAGV